MQQKNKQTEKTQKLRKLPFTSYLESLGEKTETFSLTWILSPAQPSRALSAPDKETLVLAPESLKHSLGFEELEPKGHCTQILFAKLKYYNSWIQGPTLPTSLKSLMAWSWDKPCITTPFTDSTSSPNNGKAGISSWCIVDCSRDILIPLHCTRPEREIFSVY